MLAASLAGLSVLLVPAMLVRDDLKQYTADACLKLLILGLTSRLERAWSRRNLGLLTAAVGLSILLSDPAVFAGVAAFAAVLVVQLARREWRRLAEAAVGERRRRGDPGRPVQGVRGQRRGRARGLGALGRLLRAGRPGPAREPDLDRQDARAAAHRLRPRAVLGRRAAGRIVAGLVTTFRLGRPATALAAAALLPELIVLSALKIYPFGDLRTSTWLIVALVAFAAIGVGGIAALARNVLPGASARLVPGLLAVAAIAGLCAAAAPNVRSHSIPAEDVRDQATYVAAHARADDVILVNLNSNWGFAYYWPFGQPARRPSTAVRQGYEAYFPAQPRIVVARDRDPAAVRAALASALARVRPGSCATIWLVRSHVIATEQAAWTAALKAARITPVPVGTAGLTELRPGGSACR